MKSLMSGLRKIGCRFGLAVLAMACLGVMPSAEAQEDSLPSGEEIIEKSIEAMGGEEAFAKMKNRVITGTMEITGMGMKGTMKTYQARPNNTYVEVEIPNMMKVQQGLVDGIAWENNSMMGPRILEGSERDLILFSSRFDDSELADVFSSIECTGEEDVDGEACYVVVLKAEGLEPITTYFSKETYLNVKTHMTIGSQFGEMEVDIFTSDYKEVDGLLFPHRSVQSVMGQEMVMIVEKIEHNVELEEGQFDMPAEVKALLETDDSGE